MKVAVVLVAVLVLASVFTADAVKNRKRRAQRKALRLNRKGVYATTLATFNSIAVPKIKSGKVCQSVDRILRGQCYPWVFKTPALGMTALDGDVVIVRDIDNQRTWIEASVTGVQPSHFQMAVAYPYPCEIQRGGPRPYQYFPHDPTSYGLVSFNGSVTDPRFVIGVEFDGNNLNTTRVPGTSYTSSLVFNNFGQFYGIAGEEIASVVIFDSAAVGTTDLEPEAWTRVLCCNLEADVKRKATKTKKEKTTTTKKVKKAA